MQNTLFAFVLSENSETSISVLENTGKVIYYTVEKGLRLHFDQNENLLKKERNNKYKNK